MFRDVRECLDAGNRLHTLLASQKPSRKSIPILIDVEQGICYMKKVLETEWYHNQMLPSEYIASKMTMGLT